MATHRLPRPDVDGDTSGRSADCIGTQLGVRWDAVGGTLGRSWGYVGTQLGVRWDAVGGTLGRSWGYVGTRPERAEAPSPGQRPG